MNPLPRSNATTLVQHPQLVEIPQPLEMHPSVSPLAARLLEGVIEILLVTPERYNQENPKHDCGAPCCIAGHMAKAVGEPAAGWSWEFNPSAVGLTKRQFMDLYLPSNWPKTLGFVPSLLATPAEGIARIEHFLRTGQ